MAVDQNQKDYYKILGVDKNANQKDIQKAFRKLARKNHPDVNPGDKGAEERFKDINEANEVLSNPAKRQQYDEMREYYQQYGHWPGASTSAGARGGDNRSRYTSAHYTTMNEEDLNDLFGESSPFSDFFETYFGSGIGDANGGRARRTTRVRRETYASRGEDVESQVDVTLAEAYNGGTRIFELSDPDGSTRRLEVKIPPGVEEGARIRIAGQGGQGTSGRGDLYLHIHILPDPHFTREGANLRTRVDVPLTIAMLGGQVHVPTPDGRQLLLRIPPGTSNGKVFRLRGQGMPIQGQPDKRGALLVEVNVVLPTHLNAEQRQLFEAFARSLEGSNQETKVEGNNTYG